MENVYTNKELSEQSAVLEEIMLIGHSISELSRRGKEQCSQLDNEKETVYEKASYLDFDSLNILYRVYGIKSVINHIKEVINLIYSTEGLYINIKGIQDLEKQLNEAEIEIYPELYF